MPWQDYGTESIDPRDLERTPEAEAQFASLEGALNDAKTISALEKDFIDWLYHETEVPAYLVQDRDQFEELAGFALATKDYL